MKEKNYNLELIRMVSFVLVIMIHVSNYYCRAYGKITQGEYLFSLAADTAARVSVPCFFMISGALLLGREEQLRKHVRRLGRFVLVLIFWSAVYCVWNIFYMKSEYHITEILQVPAEAHLWYLYAMIPIYLVLPFFQTMCRGMDGRLEKAFLIIITAVVFLNNTMWMIGQELYYDVPIIGDRVYAYYLFLGYYIYKYKERIRLSQKTLVLTAAAGLAASFLVTYFVTQKDQVHYEGALTYATPFIILSSLCFFLFMLRVKGGNFVPGDKMRKTIDLFCGCSFGIYLIHILFLDYYKKHMKPWDLSGWIAIPVLTVCIAVLSFGCVWLLRRSSAGRRIT